jgi:pyrroline-5-carboxylate reductase
MFMKVAILGCGNMGKAIISGLLSRNPDVSLVAFDKNDMALTSLPDEVVVLSPEEWCEKENIPDAVIIAVKPQDVEESLIPFSSSIENGTFSPLWISIAAGMNISALEGFLSSKCRICRVMPNTPALIGEGISALSVNSRCSEDDIQNAEDILSACGKVVRVQEKMMNAVTGLSGSGPAYVYLFIEALIEGGIASGLPYDIARECAVQTVIGSALMVQKTSENPAALKSRVMSPAGTTVKGLMALEENKFKYAVMRSVIDAADRSAELGKKK